MYAAYDEDEKKEKFSSKGLSKNAVYQACGQSVSRSVVELYRKVLLTGVTAAGSKNTGIRYFKSKGGVLTYSQTRASIGYFYCKRQLCQDGISTVPLPVTLALTERE